MDQVLKQILGEMTRLSDRMTALEAKAMASVSGVGEVMVQVGGSGGEGSVSTDSGGQMERASVSWSDSVEEELSGGSAYNGHSRAVSLDEVASAGGVRAGSEHVKALNALVGDDKKGKQSVGVGPVGVIDTVSLDSGDQVKRIKESGSEQVKVDVVVASSELDDGGSDFSLPEPVVRMPYGKVVGEATTKVKFGSISEIPVTAGGFKSLVRNDRVLAVKTWLREKAGVVVPTRALQKLALATYAAGAMPNFFERGKDELKMLAIVGDAALTLAVARHMYGRGSTGESSQQVRSTVLSDTRLRSTLTSVGLAQYVVVPSGVDITVSKSGATAFEAIAGVLQLTCSDTEAVLKFAYATGLIESE